METSSLQETVAPSSLPQPALETLAASTTDVTFKLNNGDTFEGYLQINSDQYAVIGSTATKFSTYTAKNGQIYYQVVGGDFDGYWLSYTNRDYLYVYKAWRHARGWMVEGTDMISENDQQKVSFKSTSKADDNGNPYLFAYNAYNVLKVYQEQ